MTDPVRTPAPTDHAEHDLAIVAALATRAADLDETETTAARAQVGSCTACADALADFVALQTALPTTATPRRPRDFRLTRADAERLHRSGWRRVLGYFGSPRDGFSRPLAIGLTTLGLAGVLLASIPSATFMGASGGAASTKEVAPIEQAAPAPAASAPAASAPATERTTLGAAPPGAAFASAARSAPAPGVAGASTDAGTTSTDAASSSTDTQVFTGGNPDEVAPDITGGADTALRDDGTGFSVLFVLGGVLLIAGLGLFALRWSGRRLA